MLGGSEALGILELTQLKLRKEKATYRCHRTREYETSGTAGPGVHMASPERSTGRNCQKSCTCILDGPFGDKELT